MAVDHVLNGFSPQAELAADITHRAVDESAQDWVLPG
jgi:hypothetical protein